MVSAFENTRSGDHKENRGRTMRKVTGRGLTEKAPQSCLPFFSSNKIIMCDYYVFQKNFRAGADAAR